MEFKVLYGGYGFRFICVIFLFMEYSYNVILCICWCWKYWKLDFKLLDGLLVDVGCFILSGM